MPRSRVMRPAGIRARSPAVETWSFCIAADSAYGDKPAAASGVLAVAAAMASARLTRAASARSVRSPSATGSAASSVSPSSVVDVVSGGMVSRSRKMSVQARVISCSELNRWRASRFSATRKKVSRPSRITGSNRSAASWTSSPGSRKSGSAMSSPQDGSSPLAISCSVTATAYSSAAWS